MSFLYPHRFWLGVLAFAIVLAVASDPLLNRLNTRTFAYLANAKTARLQAEESLQQINGDKETMRSLNGEDGAVDIEKLLAPIDRLRATSMLERQAAAAQLKKFTYTLSPEQKVTVNAPGAGPQELALSTITLSAEAPLDTSAYRFVKGLRQALPGRIRPQQIVLERIENQSDLSASNLRLTATLEWLSNGVTKEMAEGH